MSDNSSDLLQELLQIASDSAAFYRDAAGAVETPLLKNEFAGMADIKATLVDALSKHIEARGEFPETGGTLVGTLRQAYADVLAALSQRSAANYTYAAQLEKTEERLLQHFERALTETDSMAVRAVLLTEFPRLRESLDQMKRMRDSLAA